MAIDIPSLPKVPLYAGVRAWKDGASTWVNLRVLNPDSKTVVVVPVGPVLLTPEDGAKVNENTELSWSGVEGSAWVQLTSRSTRQRLSVFTTQSHVRVPSLPEEMFPAWPEGEASTWVVQDLRNVEDVDSKFFGPNFTQTESGPGAVSASRGITLQR